MFYSTYKFLATKYKMNKNLFILPFIIALSISIAHAQPANDDCAMAENIPAADLETGACNAGTTDMATSDLGNGDCATDPNDVNVWFEFTALGPDITVNANSGAGIPIITLLEFNPNPCEFASAGQLACALNSMEFEGLLTPGNTYYIIMTLAEGAIGSFNVCVENPTPVPGPPNDDPCNPQVLPPNGNCVDGTTINANGDWNSPDPNCPIAENSVWYEVTLTEENNQFMIDIVDQTLTGDIQVLVGQFATDCNSQFQLEDYYCGMPGSEILTVFGLTPGETYYIMVATTEDEEGDFQICVTEMGPPPGCADNDFCNEAQVLPNIVSGQPCNPVSGCNIGASPEPGLMGCNMATEEVVWYTFTSDGVAGLLSLNVTGTEIQAPTIQVFSGSCNGLIEVSNCITGSNFEAALVNESISPNSVYYIAVSNSFGQGGNFELCVLTFEDLSACVLESELYVSPGSPSLGSPDDGPYLPGETVTFCFDLINYHADPVSSGNNCQWLQGIVPQFGDCWDMTAFDPNASMPPGLYGGTWGWFTDVTYNFFNPNITIEDCDGDGDIDICHITEPGCCNAGTNAGEIVPPGWYAWQNNDGNPAGGHPNVDYGDGNCCSCDMGPWSFCFQLTTKTYAECSQNEDFLDCEVRIYTFADGETGSWNGGASTCAQDIPQIYSASLNCCEGPVLNDVTDVVCPGGQTNIQLSSNQDPGVTFEWTVINNPNVTGEEDGSGQFITQILDNLTTSTQYVTYMVTAISESGCPGDPTPILVQVLAGLDVDAGMDIDGCAQGEFILGGAPTALGGDGGPYSYNWGNPNVPNNSNPTVSPNISTTYTVTVTDGNGCTATDQVFLEISPNFQVSVSGVTELCYSDIPGTFTQLTASPSGGTPNHNYTWNNPYGANGNQQIYIFNYNNMDAGTYTLTVDVTDANGCSGSNEVQILIHSEPSVFVVSNPVVPEMCEGGSVQLIGSSSSDGQDFLDVYNWTDPNGDPINGDFITVYDPGLYTLTVTDEFGCTGESYIEVYQVPDPEPTITAPAGVCQGDSVAIQVGEMYDQYDWNTGDDTQTISVPAGTYTVTVTNQAGCSGTEVVTINPFTLPVADIGGSSTFCEGSSTILNVDGGLTDYIWTNETGDTLSTADTLLVLDGGTYYVTVTNANGCTASASQNVTQQDFLEPNVLGDTSLCPMDCSVLDAGDGFASYMWSTGDTTKTILVCDEGDYSVTVTDAGGCFGTSVTTISINTPPQPVIDGTTSFCIDGDTDLDAGPGYSSYDWSTGDSTQTINIDTPGVYIVTVTDAENCVGTDEVSITENPSPVPSLDGDLMFCPGDSVELTAAAGYIYYAVDLDNNGSTDLEDTTAISFYVDFAGNINLTVTDTNGCTGEILVNTQTFIPPQPTISNDTASFCVGGMVSVSAQGGFVAYNWEFEDGSFAGDQQVLIADQEGIYSVTVTDDNGCTGMVSTVVVQSDQLFPAILGDTSICDGQPLMLDAGPGYDEYIWESGDTTQSISVSLPGLYTVTVYDNSGCTGTDAINIVANTTPVAVVEPYAFICNDPAGLEGTILNFASLVSGAAGVWNDDDLAGVDLNDITNVDFENVPLGMYTFSYTTNSAVTPCQNQTYYLNVEVDDCDCPNVDISGAGPICAGIGTIDLSTLQITSESGSWSLVSGPGSNPINGTIFDAANAIPGDYTIAFTLDNPVLNCDSISEEVITVIAPSDPGNSELPVVVCVGEVVQLNLGDLLAGEDPGGMWIETSTVPSTGGAFNNVNGTFNTSGQIPGDYTFEYMLSGTQPCPDVVSDPVIVTIESLPVADAGADSELDCDIPEVLIGGSGTSTGPNYTVLWTETGGAVISGDATQPQITVDEAGTYVIQVEDIVNGCVNWDTVVVSLNANIPQLSAESTDITCFGAGDGSISIISVTGGTGNLEYSIDGGLTWTSNDVFSNLDAGNYIVLVQDESNCQDAVNLNITEPAALQFDIGDNQFITSGQQITIDLNNTGLDLTDVSNIIWTENGNIICEGPACLSLTVSPQNDVIYCVEFINGNGCTIKDCIEIRIQTAYNIYAANIFSPNNDGVNDFFYVQTGADVINIGYFAIYDRWGELLFENEDFKPNVPSEGWDGLFKGKVVSPGVYIYVVEAEFEDGEILTVTGDITVIR